MATQVQITKAISGSNWVITAQILPGADIPADVFLHENTGTPDLGGYFGVANLQDYMRIQSWTGVTIPIFGNKYVKHTIANILLPIGLDVDSVVTNIKASVTRFKVEYLAGSSNTEIYLA